MAGPRMDTHRWRRRHRCTRDSQQASVIHYVRAGQMEPREARDGFIAIGMLTVAVGLAPRSDRECASMTTGALKSATPSRPLGSTLPTWWSANR